MDRDCLGPASWVNPPPSDSCLCAKGCRDKHFLARFMSRSLPSCPTEMPEKGLPQLMLQSCIFGLHGGSDLWFWLVEGIGGVG